MKLRYAQLSWTELTSRYGLVFLLLLALPIAKDGPININLTELKALLVILLLIATLPNVGNTVYNGKYQQIQLLAIFGLALTLISLLGSDAREHSIDMSLVAITSLLFMIALCRQFDFKMLRVGIIATVVVSLAICLIAILQYVIVRFHIAHPLFIELLPPEHRTGYFDQKIPVGEEGIRVSSIFFHSNQLGHYLAAAFGLFFSLSLHARNMKYKVLYSLIVVILVITMFMSQSRGGLVLLALAAVLTLFFYGKARLMRWKNILVVMIAAIAAGVSVFSGNTIAFLTRMFSPSLSSREINWSYSLHLIPDNIMYGVGRGASGYTITQEYPAVEYVSLLNNFDAKQTVNYLANNPHNYYLATVLEVGIFTLVAEVLLFGLMILYGLRVLGSAPHSIIKALAISATTILILEFVRGLFEAYSFWGAPETAGLIAFVCAMLLYLDTRLEQRKMRLHYN